MELELDPARLDQFERRMGDFGPWMHDYRFGDRIITGYFKYEGVGEQLTFVNRASPQTEVDRLRLAYESRRREIWAGFVETLFDRAAPSHIDRTSMHLLDVGSGTG